MEIMKNLEFTPYKNFWIFKNTFFFINNIMPRLKKINSFLYYYNIDYNNKSNIYYINFLKNRKYVVVHTDDIVLWKKHFDLEKINLTDLRILTCLIGNLITDNVVTIATNDNILMGQEIQYNINFIEIIENNYEVTEFSFETHLPSIIISISNQNRININKKMPYTNINYIINNIINCFEII